VKARVAALTLAAVLVFYLVTVGWRGVALIADANGQPAVIALGAGVLVLPVIGAWAGMSTSHSPSQALTALRQSTARSSGSLASSRPSRA
jgi:uncharacterized membrane protein YphA (DoxX/SURF4 family)